MWGADPVYRKRQGRTRLPLGKLTMRRCIIQLKRLSPLAGDISRRRGGLFQLAASGLLLGGLSSLASAAPALGGAHEAAGLWPLILWSLPFVLILLSIAIFPLAPGLAEWWEQNRHKLILSGALSLLVCVFFALRSQGYEGAAPGWASLGLMLKHSVLNDYIPFIVLLFSLFAISGGVRLSGDIPAHPLTNVGFLFLGSLLASLIGTTGASMVLIRPLLQINSERKHVKHTVIFFIFLVSNIGGALLPVGDPPLFLGYLRGVPFLWTLRLAPQWLTCTAILLVVYYVFDTLAHRHEDKEALRLDETIRIPIRLEGKINLLLLGGVVLAVGLLVPGRRLAGMSRPLPDIYLRELAQLVLCGVSFLVTPRKIRHANHFNFSAIAEVACLFIGIFITMRVPIELLNLTGPKLGLSTPMHFFWASGTLSSFLDNAPTYVVFFEAASSLPVQAGTALLHVMTPSGHIPVHLLVAISLGSVFMGANTYIGNGPNFLVKSIAEYRGVKMPSFFGYMAYSALILIPLFVVVSLIFLR